MQFECKFRTKLLLTVKAAVTNIQDVTYKQLRLSKAQLRTIEYKELRITTENTRVRCFVLDIFLSNITIFF